MLQHEFDSGVRRLIDHFGTRHYSESFQRLLWKSLRFMAGGIMEPLADEFIANSRQAPLLGEIVDVAARLSHDRDPMRRDLHRAYCDECGGLGYMLFENPHTGYETCGSCEKCAAGATLRARERGAIVSKSTVMRLGYTKQKNINHDDSDSLRTKRA